MNAYELADFVEISKPNDKTHQAIATMLRAQQSEIEALKKRPAINKEDGLVCAKCYERIGQ